MSETWETLEICEVVPGDRVRYRDYEFTVARIDSPFLGMDAMVCLIEDEPTRWFASRTAKRADRGVAVLMSQVAPRAAR